MKVLVNRELCEGNARCVAAAPSVFQLADDEDKVVVLVEHPGEELRAQVERAIDLCPRQALALALDTAD